MTPSFKRTQIIFLALFALGLAVISFQAGRKSVAAANLGPNVTEGAKNKVNLVRAENEAEPEENHKVTVRNIAGVPFTEFYDILRSATREQLAAWARDLAQMPRGPRQRAAVTAYYKSLVQVDYRAAIDIAFAAENLNVRSVAIDALVKSAPESIWADLALAMGTPDEDLILNWSRVDPLAASGFIEKHPLTAQQRHPDTGDDSRMVSLLTNWGEIDPTAAKNWLEADASRQTSGSFRALLTSWGRADPSGASDYAVANAQRPNFDAAVNELVYQFVRSGKENATSLLLGLPLEQAKTAWQTSPTSPTLKLSIRISVGRPDYQRPPDEIARWMIDLPVELWKESIGVVAQGWMRDDAAAATTWFDQLPPVMRETAVVSFCSARQSAPREDVLPLAWTIQDPKLREKALGKVARSLRMEREEAIEAIDDLELSAEQKAYLRKVMPKD